MSQYADGTIFYRADRQKWIAVLDGYQMAARNTPEACRAFLINKRFTGTIVIIESGPTVDNRSGLNPRLVDKSGDIQDWIRCEARVTVEKANNLFGLSLSPVVDFCRGSVGGKARGTKQLWFNTILASENKDIFHQTIKHEVAHLVVNAKYNVGGYVRRVRPHGREFMNTLVHLGGKPERYHSMDTTNATVGSRKTCASHCACKTHMVTPRLFAKITAYRCRKCKTYLKAGAFTG